MNQSQQANNPLTPDELIALTVCVAVYEEENGHVVDGVLAFFYGAEHSAFVRNVIRESKSAMAKLAGESSGLVADAVAGGFSAP